MRGWKPLIILLALVVFVMTGPTPVVAEESERARILFDYTHGQYSTTAQEDLQLESRLLEADFTVDYALEDLNATRLSNASVLVIGSLIFPWSGITLHDIESISDWFMTGNKMLWVGCDSDYTSGRMGQWVNDNMTALLSAVGSHVFPEPTQVIDPESNCGQEHFAIANHTSQNPIVESAVSDVNGVLMHGATLLYGAPNPFLKEKGTRIALERVTIPNVFPLIYYSPAAFIYDYDKETKPVAHNVGEVGQFVACTLERIGSNVIVVSGSAPYGSPHSMCVSEFMSTSLDGLDFVSQTIERGHELSMALIPQVFIGTGTSNSMIFPLVLVVAVIALAASSYREKDLQG